VQRLFTLDKFKNFAIIFVVIKKGEFAMAAKKKAAKKTAKKKK